jgi:ornithine carbamoyltransferase
MKKDFLTLKDYDGETIKKIIMLGIKFKQNRPIFGNTVLKDKSVALI